MRIASDIIAHLPGADSQVVDFGCGDTLSADKVADACGHLYLCDAAPMVLERLASRYAGVRDIAVVTPEEFARLEPGALDLIVVNSVVQYLSKAELDHFVGDVPREARPQRTADACRCRAPRHRPLGEMPWNC